MEGENDSGQKFVMDWKNGPSPMHMIFQSIGGCSLVDLVIGLKEREFSDVWIDLVANRREESPRIFTDVMMVYNIKGNVPQKLAERIVEKSHEKYCSVSNMVKDTVEINWKVELHAL